MSASGLEGVVAAETALSRVDGERGELLIAGVPVEELAGAASFEQVCALLWGGARDPDAVASVQAALGAGRVAAFELLPGLGSALEAPDGMDALRAALAHLPSPAGDERAAQGAVTGAVGVYLAAWWRTQSSLPVLAPDPAAGHAADTLRMLGLEPEPARVRALETYLAAVVDHGLNASTFTARIVASTRSDQVSAVVAALGALKGPLHGGAPGPVLDMLDAVGRPEQVAAWIQGELAAGRRLMGMGHRVYRVRDPRAAVLQAAAEALGADPARLSLARAVEAEAARQLAERHPGRTLAANVEFYTAVLLEAIGLDRRLFSPTFALARVAGWLAHVSEQRACGRLIRPRARYVGPIPTS